MKFVAGIDEAGLGPTLGPLVFGCTLFALPDTGEGDLYARLSRWIGRLPGDAPQRLPIDDSKRLFAGRKQLAPLELTALACLEPQRGALPTALDEIAERAGSDWPCFYGPCRPGAPELPREVDAALAQEWRRRVATELPEVGVTLARCFVRPVLERELNGQFLRGRNKAEAVLHLLAPLVAELVAAAPGDLELRIDRLGGRRYYAPFLAGLFPFRPLTILRETAVHSSYAIREGGRALTFHFEVEGDGRHLPVGLASVAAKYVRELFLHRLNGHFAQRKPSLRPTAGYPEDAARWLADVGDHLSAAERTLLVRQR